MVLGIMNTIVKKDKLLNGINLFQHQNKNKKFKDLLNQLGIKNFCIYFKYNHIQES